LSSSASSIALSMFDCCIIVTICIVIVISLSAWFLLFCCHCHCRCCFHLSCIVVARAISLTTLPLQALSIRVLNIFVTRAMTTSSRAQSLQDSRHRLC
jgi:hypothetical protein